MRFVLRTAGFVISAALAVSSCARSRTNEPATAAPTPVVDRAVSESPPVEAAPHGPTSNLHTAVLVSADIPEYTQIVAEILRRDRGEVTVHTLSGQPANAKRVVGEVGAEKPDRIIAVGLSAAIAARAFGATPMVFCQVFNYQDHALVSATSKGVDLLPPFEPQLRAWRALAPNLHHVGVITGPGHDASLAQMQQAAVSSGVELTARVVRTDLEALHEFREMAPHIDGLWLLPDNRVLSPDVVREVFAYSTEHDKQVATFGQSLLKMGALLSLTADPRDVVDRVLERLDAVDASGRLPGPDMTHLTLLQTQINDDVARRLGLVAFERRASAE